VKIFVVVLSMGRSAEHEQDHGEEDGEVTGTRIVPGAEGQSAALSHMTNTASRQSALPPSRSVVSMA
jgi:hypothetical protein